MTSRIVHTRVKDKTLLTLIKYLEADGRSIEGRPLSGIVSSVLDGVAGNFVRTGAVADIPSQEATRELDHRYAREVDLPQRMDLRDDIARALGTDEDGGERTEVDREAVMQAVQEKLEPDLREEGPLQGGEEIPQQWADLDNPPWKNVERIEWDRLERAAPKDVGIETLEKVEHKEIYKRAVEVVYSSIDATNWGSEATMKKVIRLYSSYLPWAPIYQEGETDDG